MTRRLHKMSFVGILPRSHSWRFVIFINMLRYTSSIIYQVSVPVSYTRCQVFKADRSGDKPQTITDCIGASATGVAYALEWSIYGVRIAKRAVRHGTSIYHHATGTNRRGNLHTKPSPNSRYLLLLSTSITTYARGLPFGLLPGMPRA